MKVLIAEDDENMCKILRLYLEKEGYQADIVNNGEDAVAYFESNRADLMLLDWMMPKKSGIEVCKEIRLMKVPVKIIMLTAKAETSSELRGLVNGADDYIRKPFDMNILLIRIKKLCNMESVLSCGDISLNPLTYEVLKKQEKLELTKKEYELLKFFMSNQNIVLTREQILDHVWGLDYEGDVRTVDTHIRRLRRKIYDSCIRTSFGTGYIMGERDE